MNYKSPFDFTGKVVLITGGGGSIGSEFGRAFSECGATVVLADKNREVTENVASLLRAEDKKVFAATLDLMELESIKQMVQEVVEKFGKIDVLCNHAGFNNRKPAIEYSEKEWDEMVGVNLKGLYFTATEVGKVMIGNKSGKIINTASVSALRAHKTLSIYAVTKSAVVQLTKALAHEWAEFGIQVNSVGPGYVFTNQTKEYLSNPEVAQKILSKIPAGRYATVNDIANAVLFLASEKANYITGHTLYVDGGRLVD